jgi:hypothetical protein
VDVSLALTQRACAEQSPARRQELQLSDGAKPLVGTIEPVSTVAAHASATTLESMLSVPRMNPFSISSKSAGSCLRTMSFHSPAIVTTPGLTPAVDALAQAVWAKSLHFASGQGGFTKKTSPRSYPLEH